MTDADHWFTIFRFLVAPDIIQQASLRGLDPNLLNFENIIHHANPTLQVDYGVNPVYILYLLDKQMYYVLNDLYYSELPEGLTYIVATVDRAVSMIQDKVKQQESDQDATQKG